MLYCITPDQIKYASLKKILQQHPEVQFVSLMGVDLAGNDTDEKIPMRVFWENIDSYLQGNAAQTDGSSVVLPGIATLNDAKVDLKADATVNWYVDYNYEHQDPTTGNDVGTLRIPCYLVHNNKHVCSRSILADTLKYVAAEMKTLLNKNPHLPGLEHINGADVKSVDFTCATELEFWVKSPSEAATLEVLSSSQILQEQYWARARGNVRTALEETIQTLEKYGLKPEMGHKENGGKKGQLNSDGHMTHIMEQLEIDWSYSLGVQTADNEILARNVVKETFRKHGLEVSFEAKPIAGVAGSGEHTHVGMVATTKRGKKVNLFAPKDMHQDFMSSIGYGALMGILKNYEVINPFISSTTDAFNRLQPGYEAPVCVVTSLGLTPEVPSRNRSILVGLLRDVNNPMATRFEVRSPNVYTNTYIALAVLYLAALDGIKACVKAGKSLKALEKEISKKYGEAGFYLEKNREYRSEKDVFEDFTPAERDKLFGHHPATVWENLQALTKYPEKRKVLTAGGVFLDKYIDSFCEGAFIRWRTELALQYVPEFIDQIKAMKKLNNVNKLDEESWQKVQKLREKLSKDDVKKLCMFTQLRHAVRQEDYAKVSKLQVEIWQNMQELEKLYHDYRRNIMD